MAHDDDRRIFPAWSAPLVRAITALWFLLLLVEWARPNFFLHDDNATWFLPAYVHDFRTLAETGRFAQVNFFQYGGEPFLEQGQTGVLYPPIYLGIVLAKLLSGDIRWVIDWLAVLHLTAGLAGFYLWLARCKVDRGLAALAALAWVLNPFVLILGASWITVVYLACYLPWLFWALDRLLAKPTTRAALNLGLIVALFFLQGYVQWFVYAIFFLSFYLVIRLLERSPKSLLAIFSQLIFAMLITVIFTAPLFLPMLHAVSLSAARAQPFPLAQALSYRVSFADLVSAQFGFFRPHLFYSLSTALLFCPALLLSPWPIYRFFSGSPEIRRRLFPLLLLGVLAMIFSSRWHVLLSLTPVFEKFRWPFKVFVFADFFLLAALAWSLPRNDAPRRWTQLAYAALALVLVAGTSVALLSHDTNLISKTGPPGAVVPLLNGIDPGLNRSRVVAADTNLPEASAPRFFTHCYSTYFEIPSIGGYDPLVSRAALDFAAGLDFPNLFTRPITAEVRSQLGARGVRFWIVDPYSPQVAQLKQLGLTLLSEEPDRVVFADELAAPIVHDITQPLTPCPISYSGNSLHVDVSHATSPIHVSLGPTDGWWYRVDNGPWQRGKYEAYPDYVLEVPIPPQAGLVEVSYFDARFREGLILSTTLLPIALLVLAADCLRRKQSGNGLVT